MDGVQSGAVWMVWCSVDGVVQFGWCGAVWMVWCSVDGVVQCGWCGAVNVLLFCLLLSWNGCKTCLNTSTNERLLTLLILRTFVRHSMSILVCEVELLGYLYCLSPIPECRGRLFWN